MPRAARSKLHTASRTRGAGAAANSQKLHATGPFRQGVYVAGRWAQFPASPAALSGSKPASDSDGLRRYQQRCSRPASGSGEDADVSPFLTTLDDACRCRLTRCRPTVVLVRPLPSYAAIETERVGERVLLTWVRGHVTRLLVEERFDQFRSLAAEAPSPIWILEQQEMTGFDPYAVAAGARWFSAFKARGGELVISVSPLSAARMALASLAFAVHAKVYACETLKEAYERAGLGAVETRPSLYSLPPPSRSSH